MFFRSYIVLPTIDFSFEQTSTSVRQYQTSVAKESVPTRSAATSVFVREAKFWTQSPRSVSVGRPNLRMRIFEKHRKFAGQLEMLSHFSHPFFPLLSCPIFSFPVFNFHWVAVAELNLVSLLFPLSILLFSANIFKHSL